MTEPCTNESRIAVLENLARDFKEALAKNTEASTKLAIVLARMEGGNKLGAWALPIVVTLFIFLVNYKG